jgi:excinuclease ABC subunit B
MIQRDYNQAHNIVPATVEKAVTATFDALSRPSTQAAGDEIREPTVAFKSLDDVDREVEKLEAAMKRAARELAFEEAARLRDRIKALRRLQVFEM